MSNARAALALLVAAVGLACACERCPATSEAWPRATTNGACCPPGQRACGATCTALSDDADHCGACDRRCAPSQVCEEGRCVCRRSKTFCPVDGCVDTSDDPSNCGACATRCRFGERCVGGVCGCRKALERYCDGLGCIDTSTDPANCGACGRTCRPAEVCAAGRCGCPEGQLLCAGACVDPMASSSHCGACNRACNRGQLCRGGRCVVVCPTGLGACDATRPEACETDLLQSAQHCGACFRACTASERCSEGVCVNADAPCPGGPHLLSPERRCTPASAAMDCGAVANARAACQDGRCVFHCACGYGRCATDAAAGCTTSLETPADCGACGRRCARGERCVAGACECPPGQSRCGERCVSLAEDASHCNACGAGCAAGEACKGSLCVPRPAPGLLAPPSGAVLATRRPTFRWAPAARETSATVEVCPDRACATTLARWTAAATSLTAPSDLPGGAMFWRVRPVLAMGASGAVSPTWPLRLHGAPGTRGGLLGHTLDVDGDGRADLLLRASRQPRLCVYLGSAAGLRRVGCRAVVDASGNEREFVEPMAFGDFDGDGFTDLAARERSSRLAVVLVVRGGAGGIGPAAMMWRFDGPWASSVGGLGLYGVGDIDDDGFADLAVTDPTSGAQTLALHTGGRTDALWLPQHLVTTRDASRRALAGVVVNVGDTDGDGRGDLVAEPTGTLGPHPLFVVRGSVDGPRDAPLGPWRVEFATRATLAGDFDGDGRVDLALPTSAGIARFPGSPSGPSRSAREEVAPRGDGAAWATSFDGARDLDGDGRGDLVERAADLSSCHLVVRRGGASGWEPPAEGQSFQFGDDAPEARWLGDVNGDGRDDLALIERSAVRVYLGAAGGLPAAPSQTLPGPDVP